MSVLKKASVRAEQLKQNITALYYAYRHPDTGSLPRIIIFITLFLAVSPIDLIPDFIPVFGYLDDLILIPLLIKLSIKTIPPEILELSLLKAQKKPFRLDIKMLKKN